MEQEYQKGFEAGLKHAEKNYFSADTINESIDKFLDKINNLKSLIKEAHDFIDDNVKTKIKKKDILKKLESISENEDKNGKAQR